MEPFNGTGEPFSLALTAFFVVQVSVVLPPGAMELGLAVIPAAGAPVEPLTVTVTWP